MNRKFATESEKYLNLPGGERERKKKKGIHDYGSVWIPRKNKGKMEKLALAGTKISGKLRNEKIQVAKLNKLGL